LVTFLAPKKVTIIVLISYKKSRKIAKNYFEKHALLQALCKEFAKGL